MKRIWTVFVAAGLGAALFSSLAMAGTIVETAEGAGQFKTLVAAVEAAGLVDDLNNAPALTVFAPTDAAFAALPKSTLQSMLRPENRDKLRAILTYHVIGQKIPGRDVPHKPTAVKTLNGAKVHVVRKGRAVRVNDAHVVKADVQASNGVIHVINKVLIPKS